jgi:hypothetical protein
LAGRAFSLFRRGFFFASSALATVGARRSDDDPGRLLSQIRSPPTSSTSLFEMIDRGATAVTSTLSFANLSRCLTSSHSFPFGDRPLIRNNAHSPNIFLPYILNFRSPCSRALTGSSPGPMSSHVPLSQMMTFPAP